MLSKDQGAKSQLTDDTDFLLLSQITFFRLKRTLFASHALNAPIANPDTTSNGKCIPRLIRDSPTHTIYMSRIAFSMILFVLIQNVAAISMAKAEWPLGKLYGESGISHE